MTILGSRPGATLLRMPTEAVKSEVREMFRLKLVDRGVWCRDRF